MSVNRENDTPKRKRVRCTAKQINVLTDYMAAHPRLANYEYHGPQGKAQRNRQWEALRIMLRQYGPDKTLDQWEHTWRDLRRSARNNGARVYSAQRATGNIVDVPELSPQIIKVLGTIGPESASGITGAEETGAEIPDQTAHEEAVGAILKRQFDMKECPPEPPALEQPESPETDEDPPSHLDDLQPSPSTSNSHKNMLQTTTKQSLKTCDKIHCSKLKRPYPSSGFLEHIANKMSAYDQYTRSNVELKISKILYEADISMLRSQSSTCVFFDNISGDTSPVSAKDSEIKEDPFSPN